MGVKPMILIKRRRYENSDSGFESRNLGYYGRIQIHKLDLAGKFINKNETRHYRTCTVYPALSLR